jgi:signal transduction histidine kinase
MSPLENAELFRNLDPEPMAAVRRMAEERTFAAGQEVFREGDPGDGLYVVKSGLVEISGQLGTDVRQVFSQVGAGGVFGEMAVIEQLPRSAFAVVVQAATVYFLPRERMVELIERTPVLALAFMKLVSQRLRDFNQHHLREVVQAERLAVVGQFARSIVHDLKNPLNIISLTADMYARPEATPSVRASAQVRIQKQVERINDLVADLLQFTQAGQRCVPLPVNYATFIEQLTAELRPELELKSVQLKLANLAPAIELSLDVKRLRRVFVNLVANATDVIMDEGTITLRFHQEDGEVITEIADSGPGIAREMADKLFQPFATHGKAHGTGLGLSICKKIIEDHGGRIWAANGPQGGAVFSFVLPLVGSESTTS